MPQGGNLPFGLAPSGDLTSYTPTLRERATDWVRKKLFTDDRAGQGRANRVMDVASVTPFGFGLDVYDAGREAGMGNYGTAGLMLGMAGAPGPAPKSIRAFHGSPHDFDKFDMSKIGTGEGAQAYGHGLYFAENEDIARGYRDALKPGKGLGPEDTASRVLDMHGGDTDAAIASLRNSYNKAMEQNAPYEDIQRLMQARNILNTQPQRASGRMYEVNINADPDAFLDWDKPLSDQPEAVRRLAGWTPEAEAQYRSALSGDTDNLLAALEGDAQYTPAKLPRPPGAFPMESTGAQFYESSRLVPGDYRDKVAAAQKLREAGIPGIKYLDAGSRGAGDGTRNYVVFDDSKIEIVRKFGIAGASAILGYNILDGMDPAQAEELKRIEGNQ